MGLLQKSLDQARGWNGSELVYLCDVWADPQMLAALIGTLHKSGKITLARADLVQAMDADRLRASEITVDGAVFHFIRRDQSSLV